jgi:hypothetical protein
LISSSSLQKEAFQEKNIFLLLLNNNKTKQSNILISLPYNIENVGLPSDVFKYHKFDGKETNLFHVSKNFSRFLMNIFFSVHFLEENALKIQSLKSKSLKRIILMLLICQKGQTKLQF